MRIEADLAPRALADQVTRQIRHELPAFGLDPGVSVEFEGNAKQQSTIPPCLRASLCGSVLTVRRFWILSVVITLIAGNVAAAAHVCDAWSGPANTSVVPANDSAGDASGAGAVGFCDFCLYAATLAIGQRPPEALAILCLVSVATVAASTVCSDPLLSRLDEPPR